MSFDEADLIAELPRLRRVVSIWRVPNPEDLIQTACERAWRNRHLFDGSNLYAWLVTLMHNERITMARHASRYWPSHRSLDSAISERYGAPPAQDDARMLSETVAFLNNVHGGLNLLALSCRWGDADPDKRLAYKARQRLLQWSGQ